MHSPAPEGGLPVADAWEHRIQSGRSGILGVKLGWDRRSQLRRGRQRGHLGWVCVGKGLRRMTRNSWARGYWGRIKGEDGRAATFIDIESGSGTMHTHLCWVYTHTEANTGCKQLVNRWVISNILYNQETGGCWLWHTKYMGCTPLRAY
jgi:hypothetical protein